LGLWKPTLALSRAGERVPVQFARFRHKISITAKGNTMASKHQIAEQHGLADTDPLLRIFDYNVQDQGGEKVGTVNNVWPETDGSGIAFIGVRTGWLLGKDHVIPAYSMQVDHENRTVRLPLSKEEIKRAPDFDITGEITRDDSIRVREYYRAYLPRDRQSRPSEGDRANSGADGERVDVPIHGEKLKVGKREVEDGGVRIRRVVRTETVETPVELKREDIVVERVPAEEASGDAREIAEGETYIPLRREEPVIEKTAEVTGAVRVRKTTEQKSENVRETVRKEDVKVERESAGQNRADSTEDNSGCGCD
jgi:uncharacterized protein (TIGR02271 family)